MRAECFVTKSSPKARDEKIIVATDILLTNFHIAHIAIKKIKEDAVSVVASPP